MAIDFPVLTPSARQFTTPEWPTNSLDSQAGTTTRRLWGSEPARAQLTLTFSNIGDRETAEIMQCHYDAKGACEEVNLRDLTMGNKSGFCDFEPLDPNAPVDELVDNLEDLIQFRNGDHRWHFAERGGVSVQSVAQGLSTVTCKFRSEIAG